MKLSCGERFASSAIRCCFGDTVIGLSVPLVFLTNGSVTRSLPSLLTGFPGIGFPAFHRYYEGTKTSRFLPASSVAFAGRYHLPRDSGHSLSCMPVRPIHEPGTCSAGFVPPGNSGVENYAISQVPREPQCAFALLFDPGGTAPPSQNGGPVLPPLI